jgi:hypothetical protein
MWTNVAAGQDGEGGGVMATKTPMNKEEENDA